MREYQEFPISNFRTGFDEAVEPWLLPRDAFQIVKNAHLYRGVLEKIPGASIFASMSYRNLLELTGTIDGVNTTFTGTLSPLPTTNNFSAQAAINAGATQVEVFSYLSDASASVVNLQSNQGGTGTVNILTGDVSLTFNTPPAMIPGGGNLYNAVIFSYDSASPGLDIMGIKQYFGANNSREVLVFDTRRMGVAIPIEGILASQAEADYGIEEVPHEVRTANLTPSPIFDGVTLTFTGTAGGSVVPGTFNLKLYTNAPALSVTATDNGIGLLQGTGVTTGFVNYATGAFTITYAVAPAASDSWNLSIGRYGDIFTGDYTNFFDVVNYSNLTGTSPNFTAQFNAFITNNKDQIFYYNGTELLYLNPHLSDKAINSLTPSFSKCLHLAINRERLLIIAPDQQTSVIYWSTPGNPFDFSNDEFLPAPTSQAIRDFSFINTDMVVRFSNSEYVFRYTSDAFSPFRWDATNSLWRCDANYSAINYDSYFTSVGKPAIVGSDGVNVKRADEIIPDFTLNNRVLNEGPIISIQQNSMGQCYGERFDDFKEGWLCFKSYSPSDTDSTVIARANNILAFNYLDETYAVYTFPFNVLGYGSVTAENTWGNNFDTWENAQYAWQSYFESFGSIINLGGHRNGKVYILGDANTYVDADGVTQPVLFDVISKNFNPFIENGELCRFGYLDLFVSANTTTTLRVQFFANDNLYEDANGEPAGYYQESVLTFIPTDSMSSTTQTKIWKRIYIGAVAKEHTIRFYQKAEDFSETDNQPVRIHSMVLYMKPAGRIFN